MYIRIKLLREKHSLSIEEISNFLEISSQKYIQFESGKKEISVELLSKLARLYNTSIDYIVELTDCPVPHKKINF